METNVIGNKIATARKQGNLSQSQLAEKLFISPQAVGKWERGESVPDIITVSKLAEILGVDLNYFSDNFKPVPAETTVAENIPAHNSEPARPAGNRSWDMSGGNWVDADFSGLKNLHEKFTSSNLQRCKFAGSDMSGLLLKNNHVEGCDFSGSDLGGSRMEASHVVGNVFTDCILKGAEFSESYFKNCDFTGADFTGAKFRNSSLLKNTMTHAVLKQTSFNATDITGITFEGTVEDCYFDNCTFSRVTFQNAKLVNTFFKCKSLKQIRFIDCEADRITYEFLKNGKADLSGITLITA